MKSLIDIFNSILTDAPKDPDRTFTPKFKIKPSSLGTPCMRKIYYASAGVPEDYGFDLSGKKRMAIGDAIHEMLHAKFKEAGVVVEYINPDGTKHKKYGFGEETTEFPLPCEDLFIKNAYVDDILIIDGELWTGEYKSINQNGFNSLTGPKSDHIIQAVTYFFIFNKLLAEGKFSHIPKLQGFTNAKGVRWLYVNKDDGEMKEFTMTEADKIFSDIVEKIVKAYDNFNTRTLPPKTQDWCNSCPYRNKCKKNYNF